MSEAIIAQTMLTFLLLVVLAGLFIWGLRTKQYHNIEEPKYRLLDLAGGEEDSDDNGRTG